MAKITIRKAVSPDIEVLSQIDHTVKTNKVWQMSQTVNQGRISTGFNEANLPRESKLAYPRSPESLLKRWKDFAVILTACESGNPIAYLTISLLSSSKYIWIKDLVVDLTWRRQGIASSLFKSANDWGKPRGYRRATLEMASKNYPAISFAQKLGFEFSGFNDQYLENDDIAIFFSRKIN